MGKIVEIEAKGVMRVTPYGITVDGVELMKEIAGRFDTKKDFSGTVHIMICDESKPVRIATGEDALELAQSRMETEPPSFRDFMKMLLDDEEPDSPDEPEEDAEHAAD